MSVKALPPRPPGSLNERLTRMPTERLTKRAYVDLLRTASAACRTHAAR